MSKINQVANQHLTKNDGIVQHYRSIHNNIEGSLVMSKQRLLFIKSTGLFRKTYHTILNLPYDTITSTNVEASHRFTISTNNDTFAFATIGIQADIVDDTLQHLIDTAKPKPAVKAKTVKVAKTRKRKKK